MSKKIEGIESVAWCYSIYGTDFEKYYTPMIANIVLAKELGVSLVINTNKSSEKIVRTFFADFVDEVYLYVHECALSELFPKILRFLSVEKHQALFYFFKDSDSIVTQKEIEIMNYWMFSSNTAALIIRDHPLHISPIMAGMLAMRKELAVYISRSARDFFGQQNIRYNDYSYDQDWLAERIYPIIAQQSLVATSFFYFTNENCMTIDREVYQKNCIGAQVYKSDFSEVTDCLYYKFYKDGLLFLPYCRLFLFLYGRVRPTLFFAYVYKKLIAIKRGVLRFVSQHID